MLKNVNYHQILIRYLKIKKKQFLEETGRTRRFANAIKLSIGVQTFRFGSSLILNRIIQI